MGAFFESLWLSSEQAACVAGLVCCVTVIFRRQLTPAARYGLWSIVLLRLIVPAPGSRVSLFNLWPVQYGDAQVGKVVAGGEMRDFERFNSTPALMMADEMPSLFSPMAVVWFVGALASCGYVVIATWMFHRRVGRSRLVDDPAVLELLSRCAEEIGCRRRIDVRETDSVTTPALGGLWRPVLLFPPAMLARLSRGELRLVFRHELAHLRGHDIGVDRVLALFRCVHWFNPAVYFAMSQFRAEREFLRDAAVLRGCDMEQRQTYGQALLRLAQFPSGFIGPGMVGMVEPKRQLRRRIQAVAAGQRRSGWSVAVSLAAVIAVGCTSLTSRPAVAEAPPTPAEAPATTQPVAGGSNKGPVVLTEIRFVHMPAKMVRANAMLNGLQPGEGRVVSADEVRRLLDAVKSSRESSLIATPRVTTFDGQLARIMVGQEQAYVKEYVRGAGGLLQPKLDVLKTGIEADVRGKVGADGGAIQADVRVRVASLISLTPAAAPNDPKLWIQVPTLSVVHGAVWQAIPDGGTYAMIANDPQIEPANADGKLPATDQRLVILIHETIANAQPAAAARPAK